MVHNTAFYVFPVYSIRMEIISIRIAPIRVCFPRLTIFFINLILPSNINIFKINIVYLSRIIKINVKIVESKLAIPSIFYSKTLAAFTPAYITRSSAVDIASKGIIGRGAHIKGNTLHLSLV